MNSTEVRSRLSPAYWRLWAASTISNLGDGVFLVALPLLASRLTRSELSISIGAALGGIVTREFGLRAPFFVGAGFGAVALVTLFVSITPDSLAELERANE
ncbi:MAG: hypothetical protein ABI862_15520 [Ilumatobacteraceae bacterium]